MYKLMIVDDEPEIREHIKSLIDWSSLGVLLVGEAGDADTALEDFYLFHPQIAILDICLSGRDGLSLAQELFKEDPGMKVIVISSYQDFSYAQKALSIGVSNYLTKPIVQRELNDSLQNIISDLTAKKEDSQRNFAVEQVIEKNKDVLLRWQLEEVLHGEITAPLEQVKQQFALLNMELPGANYTVVMISVHGKDEAAFASGFQPAAVKQYVETKLSAEGYCVFSYYDDDRILNCLVSRSEAFSDEEFEQQCLSLHSEVALVLGLDIHIGIGVAVDSLTGIGTSAKQARFALQNAHSLMEEAVVGYVNLKEVSTATFPPARLGKKKLFQMMFDCIRSGNVEGLEKVFASFSCQLITVTERKEFAVEFLSEMSQKCIEAGLNPWQMIDYPLVTRQLFSCEELREYQNMILSLCEKMIGAMRQQSFESNSYLIKKAKEYIKAHFSEKDLSLEKVSAHVGLSKVYFCSLFHKFEGVTFKNYLMEIRMRYAKHLLTTTDKKIYEISCDVGCTDSAYFNRVFKRTTGVTPLQYRNNVVK